MPGSEPSSRLPNNTKSTVPMWRWPSPATAVSGTAWAMSVPTMRAVGRPGYRKNNIAAPSAPAPTEVIVTSTPNTMPAVVVAAQRAFPFRQPRAAQASPQLLKIVFEDQRDCRQDQGESQGAGNDSV